MNLNDIPQEQRGKFPTGVSEQEFDTKGELRAFLLGLGYAENIDVESGTPFQRDDKHVVRVRVGDWQDEDNDEA